MVCVFPWGCSRRSSTALRWIIFHPFWFLSVIPFPAFHWGPCFLFTLVHVLVGSHSLDWSALISDEMSTWGQIKDLAHHTVLPLMCYVVGGFAVTTMMMKNNLMDNLAADYVRTAVSKGVGFKKAVFGHAFRNSFIPIATSLGHLVSIFVGGSMLVETVFDIQGFGLLQFQSIIGRDQPVIMGTLTIAAFLMVLGNILSDIIVAMIDPRIKFN